MVHKIALRDETIKKLSNLPEGWDEVVLEKVGEIHSGSGAPKGEEYFKNGTLPFVTSQDIGRLGRTTSLVETERSLNTIATRELRLVKVPKGTILFPNNGGSLLTNNRAITGTEAAIEANVAAIMPNPGEWNSLYVYYWLCTVDMKNYSNYSAQPTI